MTIEIPLSELERKIRLLTLTSLAFQYVGQNLPYSKISEALQVDPNDVEKWAIDGWCAIFYEGDIIQPVSFSVIRAGLVWGKLSQTTESLHITRATSRHFEKEQWLALEKRLIAWKSSLVSILDVIANAKRVASQITTQD